MMKSPADYEAVHDAPGSQDPKVQDYGLDLVAAGLPARFRRNELATTDSELRLMATLARTGPSWTRPPWYSGNFIFPNRPTFSSLLFSFLLKWLRIRS